MIRQKLLHVFKNQNATNIPVGVGFGISDAASAKAMGNVADAVIVGSAFVKNFATLAADDAVEQTVSKVMSFEQRSMS